MFDLSKISDWLKMAPRYLVGVAICAGIYLALGPNHIERFGFEKADSYVRPWIGAMFLAAVSLLAAHLVADGSSLALKLFRGRLEEHNIRGRFKELSPAEKEVLAGYLRKSTKTRYLSTKSGVVGGLAAADIIYRSSNIGSVGFSFAYNLRPWAWRYFQEHPEMVETESDALSSRRLGGGSA